MESSECGSTIGIVPPAAVNSALPPGYGPRPQKQRSRRSRQKTPEKERLRVYMEPLTRKTLFEKLLSWILTAGHRRNAFCDSKIWLCLPCAKLRAKIHGAKWHILKIYTKGKVYIYEKATPLAPAELLVKKRHRA
ncbi:MAG: hypothetical protein QW146_03785 [Candidatus Bathyarchaeia archaeon]